MPQPIRLHACILEIIDHAPGLRTFILEPERPVPRFRPGQFLHLAMDSYDPSQHWPESRIFSIASPAEQRDRLRITVSAVGRFTRRMMTLRPKDEVWLKLPYGDFVVESVSDRTTVLVAGGTGITPFVSLVSSTSHQLPRIVLLYGARTPDLLIYRDILEQVARQNPTFHWVPFVEQGEWPGARPGRLSAKAAMEAAGQWGDPARATYYLSGPPAMLSALKGDLIDAGMSVESIRIDAWE